MKTLKGGGDMSTSDKIFSDLGFEKTTYRFAEEYVRHGNYTVTTITFYKSFYTATKFDIKDQETTILEIDAELHEAISKKLEELDW